MDLILPFKIGDLIEAKSLVEGFRGAWFRSKIIDMRVTESGHLEYFLEYVDYPEEATEWISVFQKNPLDPTSHKKKSSVSSQIMVRPPFPQWYREDQVPEEFSKSELIASVSDIWKVGDWVEWLYEDCYWAAKVVRVISEDMVEVVCPKPPVGEGGSDKVNYKKLRPALDWSIVEGWTVRPSAANGKCWYAARLIHPESDIEECNSDEEEFLGSSSISNQISPDPSQRATRGSSKRQIPPSELVQLQPPDAVKGTTVEPNGTGERRYPLRARKSVKKAPVRQK